MNYLKKAYNTCNKVLTCSLIAAMCTIGGMAAKNLYQYNPEINMGHGVSVSDVKQMNHLDDIIRSADSAKELGSAEASAIQLYMHSYAMVNIGLSDKKLSRRAANSIEHAIDLYSSDELKQSLGINAIDVEDNIFYFSNLNMMIGGYELLTGDDSYSGLHDKLTSEINDKILQKVNLNSFPGASWTADMTTACASLSLYDKIHNTDHSKAIEKWTGYAKENLLQDGNLITGNLIREAKGSNMAYSIIFTSMFDPDFSGELYNNFSKNFYKEFMGTDLAKEWQNGKNEMDIDSGPVLFGYGSVASAFAIGAAKVNNDYEHFHGQSFMAELLTLPIGIFDEKQYLLNNSLGETVLLFCRTLRPWD